MEETIIEAKDVSMIFNLEDERVDTLKEYFLKMVKHQLRFSEFYALNNVSLEINKGESVALVGRNGSGKSTILKLIAGILYPTKGEIVVKGSIAPLIELGAGFNEQLTARENIFLNGAILGHDRQFMKQHFDEIIEFAELQDFVDVPVKNFSSGMAARLGFSIATMVKADILVVDEVLAVGDYQFQEKCEKRMKKMMDDGTTVLFVSHNMDKVKKLCNRSIWLDHGKIKMIGDSETVCQNYLLFK